MAMIPREPRPSCTKASPGAVMLVDDDPDLLELMEQLLLDSGYPVMTAADGEQALELLRDGVRPGLMIVDLVMPRMNGARFIDLVRKRDALAAIPLIAVSGNDELIAQAAALEMHVLSKPLDAAKLLAMVALVFGAPAPPR
jgi:CheY-like chemotaxis protein